MSLADPKTIGLLPETRLASRQSWADRRLAVLERGGGSPGGGGASPVTSVADTTNIELDVNSGQLTANILTTAIPQVARLGIGKAVHASASLSLDSGSLTTLVVDDTADGSYRKAAAGAYEEFDGQRWNIYHGSPSAPNTVEQPSIRVGRIESISSTTVGAAANKHCAILATTYGTSSNAMTVAMCGMAENDSTGTHVGTTANKDATGGTFFSKITGSGTGGSIALFAQAHSESTAARVVHACELLAAHDELASSVGTGESDYGCLFLAHFDAGAGGGGAGIEIDNAASCRMDYGIHFDSVNGGAIFTAADSTPGYAIRDDSSAGTSILIAGTTHSVGLSINSAQCTTCGISLGGTGGTASTGILFGGDVTLYRSAANVLRTDDSLVVAGANFRHDVTGGGTGALGFFGAAAASRTAAYTQTYATATRTHNALTSSGLTDNTAGTANLNLQALPDPADTPASADALRDDLVANLIPILRNNYADIALQFNNLRTDVLNTRQVLNQVIDDLQTYGLLQ